MNIFVDSFPITYTNPDQETYIDEPFLKGKEGFSYENGLYAILTKIQSINSKTILERCKISQVYADTVIFGKDWLGRLYGINPSTPEKTFLYDIVDTKVYSAAGDIEFFHNVVLSEDNKESLEYDLFLQWRKETNHTITGNECVSMKLPYVFGGDLVTANLEVSDLEVTWSINSGLVGGF